MALFVEYLLIRINLLRKQLSEFIYSDYTVWESEVMESLFLKLFRYRERVNRTPVEDFMTELLAYILSNHYNVLVSFLRELNIIGPDSDISDVYINTQYIIREGIESYGSRPDTIMKFRDKKQNQYLILIENKIDSQEGVGQLSKYISYLERQDRERTAKVLIYLTKNYENKKYINEILKLGDKGVKFIEIQWWQMYQVLKVYEEIEIIRETLKFMKERGLSMSRIFSTMDIDVLMNVNRIKEMIQEGLSGPVEEKYNLVTGTKHSITSADSELRNTGRYIYMSNQKDWFWVGIGYWLEGDLIDKEYPDLKVIVGVKPYHKEREKVIDAFKEFSYCNKSWLAYGLEYNDKWAGIWRKISLKDLLVGDDHIGNIQQWFLEGLEDIEEFKDRYPQLPWKVK